MQKRRIFPGILLGAVVLLALGGAFIAGLAAAGKDSALTQAWDTMVASLKEGLSSGEEATEQTVDASAPDGAVREVHRQSAPLSSAQLGAPLVHAPFIAACGAPDEMKIVAEVTVKKGRAAKVSVKSYPTDDAVDACVEKAIRDLQWDVSPKTDHVTVTY